MTTLDEQMAAIERLAGAYAGKKIVYDGSPSPLDEYGIICMNAAPPLVAEVRRLHAILARQEPVVAAARGILTVGWFTQDQQKAVMALDVAVREFEKGATDSD